MTGETRKSILITGCSSGIGLDAARTLSTRGWRVIASCRKQADVDRLRGEGLDCLRLDYEDEASICAAAAKALEMCGGRLDALFQNGAYAIPGFVEDLPTDALRAIFEANLFGWHALNRAVIPAMRAQGGGRIALCSSVLGYAAAPWRGAYNATKFALTGYADTLRMEMHGTGVEVALIEPGPIETSFNDNALAQYRRWIKPAESARRAEYRDIEARYGGEGPPNRFTLPPSAVTAKLIHALESPRPQARYMVTTIAYGGELIRRFLPRRWADKVLSGR